MESKNTFPSESLNGLTIGALYDDFTSPAENSRCIWAVDKGMPSPMSAIGKGYRSTIAPDLFYYGGRKFIRKIMTEQAHGLRLHANRDVYPLHRMKLVVRMVALSIQEQAMQQLK